MAALEALAKIKNGPTYDLSEQQILSCANTASGYTSMGCASGSAADAFTYAYKQRVGMESFYPYTGST